MTYWQLLSNKEQKELYEAFRNNSYFNGSRFSAIIELFMINDGYRKDFIKNLSLIFFCVVPDKLDSINKNALDVFMKYAQVALKRHQVQQDLDDLAQEFNT